MATTMTGYKSAKFFTPVYFAPGKFAHGIEKLSPTEYYAERRNRKKYGYAAHGQSFPDYDSALAWAQNDYNNVLKPPAIAPTTTTASFVQPAVGANVVVPVASAANMVQDQNVTIAGGGTYLIISIAGLSLTLKNLGAAGAITPGATCATAAAVTVVPK